MRLSEREKSVVIGAARRHFGEQVSVWLFGSRVRDEARGGDIDLLIEPKEPCLHPLRSALAAEVEIQSALDDPRVDILVACPGQPMSPIHRVALATGIRL